MDTQIKVTGTQQLGSIEFTGIEGGFGKSKKAMLVKDIARIHGREVKAINQAIKLNNIRFKGGVDIIDLKSKVNQNDLTEKYGFEAHSVRMAKSIYLLSERGYAKLLKILEDDKAWEIYDELVDNYFNMRSEKLDTSNLSPELQMFNGLFKSLAKQELETRQLKKETKQLESKVDTISEIVAVNTVDWRKDTTNLLNKIAYSIGGYDAHKSIRQEAYKELERRAGCQLKVRLTNKRRRMADEGASQSRRNTLNYLDVIAEDKKLIEIFVAIVKEMAVKYRIQDIA